MAFAPIATSSSQIVSLPDIPELYDPNFLDVLIPPVPETNVPAPAEPAPPTNPMIDALLTTVTQTLTENDAPAYSSTSSPTLDAFQLLRSYTSSPTLFRECLHRAWAEDPELTLHIIWNIRSIHNGKGDKPLFYKAFGWLYDNHPRTAISNLHLLVDPVCTTPKNEEGLAHGYWKDLLNILTLATADQLSEVSETSNVLNVKMKYTYPRKNKKKGTEPKDPAANIQASLQNGAERKVVAKERRAETGENRYQNLLAKLAQPKYRALYIAIARLLSERLIKDLTILDQLDTLTTHAERLPLLKQLSLASKWAPTPHGSHDRHTNIATAISMLLRHAQLPPIYPSALNNPLEPQQLAVILRSVYQRWVLTRLRSVTSLPEPLMSSNRWTEIKYNRVSSVCMRNNADLFYKHNPEGFENYITSVEKGGKKISGATLFPHELLLQALSLGRLIRSLPPSSSDDVGRGAGAKKPSFLRDSKRRVAENKLRIVEAQWKVLISKLGESGTIEDSLAVCDVSGSMGSMSYIVKYMKQGVGSGVKVLPILPAVSLSLVLAYLAKPPFDGGFITFSERPSYVKLDLSKPLHETIEHMISADWGNNTDLASVFLKLLLPLAQKHQLKQEDMIKRLYVFSDMQFDECDETSKDPARWETNHDVIEKAYKEAGYEVPQIVYWDLKKEGTKATVEVNADRKGVAMMNGYSPAMFKVFMGETDEDKMDTEEWVDVDSGGGDDEFNPLSVMRKAVMMKSFEGLVVID